MQVIAIDPGIRNLAIAIFAFSQDRCSCNVVWSNVFDISKIKKGGRGGEIDIDMQLLQDACIKMKNAAELVAPTTDTCLLEFQAPIGFSACRWNIYVEGAIASCLTFLGYKVITIQPSVAKRKLCLSTGDYRMNKKHALKFAQQNCFSTDGQPITNHHVADCFILAKYFVWLNNIFYT